MADANAVIVILQNTIGDLTRQLAITQVELNELRAKYDQTADIEVIEDGVK